MVEKPLSSGLWPQMWEPLRSFGARVGDWLSPAAEASADGKSYTIRIELPGVSEKDVDISVVGGVVTVKGEKTENREEKGETWYFSERQYGAFSRSFRLPGDADEAAVKADLKDGVLVISVPQKPQTADEGTKKVTINKG